MRPAEEQLCLDIGMASARAQRIISSLSVGSRWLKFKGYRPLLVAASRKRFIGEASGEANSALRDSGTAAVDTAAIAGGADIIRVHDVAGAVQAARVADAIYRGAANG